MILFDDSVYRNQLKPLTLNRSVGELRIGIETIIEKWQRFTKNKIGFLTEQYLQKKFKVVENSSLYINASVLPDESIWQAVNELREGEVLSQGFGPLKARVWPLGTKGSGGDSTIQ
ncbi:MAG: putative sugar nucleotidyl transferase [Spirosomataceae bacterium]